MSELEPTLDLKTLNEQLLLEIARRKRGERLLASVLDSIQDGICVLDRDMRILRVNQAEERWYSYSLPLVGKKCYEAYHNRREPCEVCPSSQTIKTGETAHAIIPKRGLGGEVIGWTDLYSFPLIDFETGEKEGVIEYARDITEQKQAEEALERSEREAKRLAQENAIIAEIGRIISSTLDIEEVYERFAEEARKLIPFDRISIGLINFDENTITVPYVAGIPVEGHEPQISFPLNGSAISQLLRTRKSILIKSADEKEIAEFFPSLLPTFRAGLRSMMLVPLISRDRVIGALNFRSTTPGAYSNQDLRLAESIGAHIAGAIANAQLYAERKQAEEALRKSEERYRSILNSIEEGYYESDLAGNLTFFNDSQCRILGYSREELNGMNNRQYMDKETARNVYEVFNRLYTTGVSPKIFNWEITRKDSSKRFLESSVSLIRDAKGEKAGFRGIVRDITERVQAEKEKAHLEEQLRQSQKMEAIGQLAGGIAHDFNNLLTVIKGYSQLSLLDLKEDNPLRANVEEIQKAAERAANLTHQVLAFSRRQVLDMKVIDLNSLLRDLDKMLHRVIREDIELATVLAGDLGRVEADPGQIEQVIMNLAVNARDAMPSGGKLTIETANVELDEEYARRHTAVKPGRYVMFAVSDTGVGMSSEVKAKVFEPFFTTKEKGKGTGLGLSVVYGVVKQSGGNIWVYSEPGHGTTFRIYLPRVEEASDAPMPGPAPAEILRGSETILLVEDEKAVRTLARKTLESSGYCILEAPNGQEALRIAGEHTERTIHLLLTDVVMPGMSGRDLADQLIRLHPELKILYMSGYTDNAIAHHGILDPGMQFLQKPFSPQLLVQKVQETLRNRREGIGGLD